MTPMGVTRVATVSNALSSPWDLGSTSRHLRGINLIRKCPNPSCPWHMHALPNGWGATIPIVQLCYQTLCPCFLQAVSFPFPAQLLWEQKGQQWQRSHLNTFTGYGWGVLRRTPGTDKKAAVSCCCWCCHCQLCLLALGQLLSAFRPWESWKQPDKPVFRPPGELHFYYWFVLCENGHHYKVLRSPIKPPWSCRLQREHKGQREDWCPSYTPAKVKQSSCLHLTYFGILGLNNLQLLFLR